ncbi:hypothetical protein [Hymenobacter jejuensis]|uniref:Porin family protein n=1 Tax=Hymenobacter jejuensis TaxID=2502781 RepID=A0A5B8A025_9BACT|nr:hypothetical protein [Hymenobacter jejuensis]QDA60620.1 hypothetical protein FHG12_11135 [Hymenobacter jejuensis]
MTSAVHPSTQAMEGGESMFRKGTTMVNLGVGLGLGYGYYGGSLKSTPAISVSAERGLLEGIGPGTIGVGGLIGYKGYHYDYPGTSYKATWSNIIVAARGTYHYNFTTNPKLDTYAGVTLGMRLEHYKDTYYNDVLNSRNNSYGGAYLTSGIFVGGRYFFTDNIGGFAELGYDMSYLKLGLTAKF